MTSNYVRELNDKYGNNEILMIVYGLPSNEFDWMNIYIYSEKKSSSSKRRLIDLKKNLIKKNNIQIKASGDIKCLYARYQGEPTDRLVRYTSMPCDR